MTSQDESNEKPDFNNIRGYVQQRVKMLFAVFNRRESEELIQVFQNRLEGFGVTILRKVFDRCETDLEKFPTVKQVLSMCYQEKPPGAWKYNYQETRDKNGVLCRIDPDPLCRRCREPKSSHPEGRGCKDFDLEPNGELLYKAEDCPEGRAFMAELKRLSEEKTIPTVDFEQARRNIQAQAIAITKHYREPGEEG